MIIKKFRVKNYKSIVDSGDCYLEDNLTIFAGKNECGKTSLLEALESFNVEDTINETAKPLSNGELIPEIIVTFTAFAEEINEYFEDYGIEKRVVDSVDIEITKKFPWKYSVLEKTNVLMELGSSNYSDDVDELQSNIKRNYDSIVNIHNRYLSQNGHSIFKIDFSSLITFKTNLENYTHNFKTTYISQVLDTTLRSKMLVLLNSIDTDLIKLINNDRDNWHGLFNLIPNFILFRSFEDNIPNTVSFKELRENQFIKDLEEISDLDINLILSKDNRKNQKHKEILNLNFNTEYAQYWSQDNTTLKIEWDSDTLYLWIIEEDEWFEPTQRSKGKQWHISFYTRISARASEEKVNIILIDEPGMFLHASAQNDIYNRLLANSEDAQIVFTTHSPYLINSKELHRVRLVLKHDTKKGTEVLNKVHAKADKETLTPIITAIGVELNQGIQNIQQVNNVVVEGPADVFYLNAISNILEINDYNFIFGGGAGNIGSIGTILNGWGCNVVYLFDNDQGKLDGEKKLKKTWLVKKELILSISNSAGAIEDLFEKDDFINIILNNPETSFEESNSLFLKKLAIDKVLLAKQFLCLTEKEKKNILSKKTIENFTSLFNQIKIAFKEFDLKKTPSKAEENLAKQERQL